MTANRKDQEYLPTWSFLIGAYNMLSFRWYKFDIRSSVILLTTISGEEHRREDALAGLLLAVTAIVFAALTEVTISYVSLGMPVHELTILRSP